MKITSQRIKNIIMEEISGQGRPWGGVREDENLMNESDWSPEDLLDQWGADQIGEAYIAAMATLSPEATAVELRAVVEDMLEKMFGPEEDEDLGVDVDDDIMGDTEVSALVDIPGDTFANEPEEMFESVVKRWNKAAGTLKG